MNPSRPVGFRKLFSSSLIGAGRVKKTNLVQVEKRSSMTLASSPDFGFLMISGEIEFNSLKFA